ncbi:hypothetical protein SAMN05661080_00528 [Modestobacter sp. DSM 44400]|uniref:sulfite exporter TauE/SafE family protein n=1 Tax=Modestobacter sp. DSM 44400 TaxID=1550230 RepID=UPI000899965F|nr:sulfite exporter TauE/SafE family protein [Modestobacter sp. DSM 44400]SDX60097.1 hypothetical protein SAMN05661080_00528 [Modestobacter sp. DSM 44400]
MSGHLLLTLAGASAAAFVLAGVSAVAGFGGGVLALPLFTALFGIRTAVPVLTVTQLASNGSRVWLNRHHLQWSLIARFSLGAVPFALAGGLLLARTPLAPLQRVLGIFLITVVLWRRLRPRPRRPSAAAFVGVGAASGLGSALLGSVGPLTAPFFLAYGLVRDSYIGTEAACALVMHLTKIIAYGATALLDHRVFLLGLALTPGTLLGAWTGKKIANRLSDRLFTTLVEAGLLVSGTLFILGP